MRLLPQNHYPLKELPFLIWAEELEFSTQLKLEECYAILASALNSRASSQLFKIVEVVWDGHSIYFAAEMTHRYDRGRFDGWAGLEGKINFNETSDKILVHCYMGDNPSTFGIPILMGLGLIIVSVIYWEISIIVGVFLSASLCWLLVNAFRSMTKDAMDDLNYEISKLLIAESTFKTYNLNVHKF